MFGSSAFEPAQIPGLAGKIILVTGGNAGLGKETILQLAKHNPERIYMASRTESKALEAIKAIKNEVPEANIEYLPLDLSSLKSVQAAAQNFDSSNSRLDLLILNAGIMATPPGKTEAGHDDQLGTNHIGHFLLTKLLLPKLQKTAAEPGSDVRVISVSSEGHNMSPDIDTITSTEKLTAKGPWTRYGASKAANVMFAAELARKYPALKSVSLHPGLIKTDLYGPTETTSGVLLNSMMALFGRFVFQSVAKGAYNQLWAAAGAKREDLVDGCYYTPVGKAHPGNKWATDADAAKKLWQWTEAELANSGY